MRRAVLGSAGEAWKMIDEPEIEACVCGRGAHLFQGPNDSRCACEVAECWKGPVCATPTAAITAWNTIVRAARERARLQGELYAAHDAILGEGQVITADGVTHAADRPTEEARKAWWDGDRSPDTMPISRCTCPDCTEHRARVSTEEANA